MANAVETTAPEKKKSIKIQGLEVTENSREHKALLMEFDTSIKYMFELAQKNPVREMPVVDVREKRNAPHKEFKPFQNIVLTSQIVWNGGRVGIRYYDGCESIFISQQPKEKDVVDQLIKQTVPRNFLDGKFGAHGDEKMLLFYLTICSWNAESEFRTRTANGIFVPSDKGKRALVESSKLDQTELALQYAKEAKTNKMLIHANYLGIPVIDLDSGNDLTEKEIRTAYRKEALRDSAKFIETYGNTAIEIKYYIDKAIEKGVISNTFNPNKATWGKNNAEICDISGMKSSEGISQKIFEFSQTAEGEEFIIQLRAISE